MVRNASDLVAARGPTMLMAWSTIAAGENGVTSSTSRPASSFE